METMTYTIGARTFEQRPLVLGQLRQLMGIMEGLKLDPQARAVELVSLLGDRLPLALAVVLSEEKTFPGDKNLQTLAREIEFSIDPQTTIQVIQDFFECNPISSWLEKLTEAVVAVSRKVASTPSKGFALSSQTETQQRDEKSSGASPS